MSTIRKFPRGGYDVTVVSRKDIIRTIDDNILDKEVLKEILTQLEKDTEDYLLAGKWVGIPFLGNIRIPPMVALQNSKEQQDLIKEARENLTKEKYILFRKALSSENTFIVKQNKVYRTLLTSNIRKHNLLYRILKVTRGFHQANFILYSLYGIKPFNYEEVEYDTE